MIPEFEYNALSGRLCEGNLVNVKPRVIGCVDINFKL